MKFVLDPTKGALIPEAIGHGTAVVADVILDGFTQATLEWIGAAGHWFLESGLPLIGEGLLLWGMVCFLIACSGSGKWIEKGTKAVGMSIMVGWVQYAI